MRRTRRLLLVLASSALASCQSPSDPNETVDLLDVSATPDPSVANGPTGRFYTVVRTDLPWWQRFPADLVADFLPIDAAVEANSTITLKTVPRVDLDAFLAHAERDGYAHRPGAAK